MILAGIEDLPLQDLKRMAMYLDKGPIRVSPERMRQELRRLRPEYEEKFMGWFSQGFFDDGVQQGRKEGRVEGEAKTLVRQLEKRFGPYRRRCASGSWPPIYRHSIPGSIE